MHLSTDSSTFSANVPTSTTCLSGRLRALGVDVECVERLTGSHEQAVFLGAPETKICAGFRDMNSADELAIGREHVHSVKTLASPPGRDRKSTRLNSSHVAI